MITSIDLRLGDDDLANRIIAYARGLAPCIDNLPPGTERESVVAILRSAGLDAAERVRGLKSHTAGDWTWTYFSDAEMSSVWTDDDRRVLASICPAAETAGGPVGCFPPPPEQYKELW